MPSVTRQWHIDNMREELDSIAEKFHEQGHEKGMVTVQGMAERLEENEWTLRRNGFPKHFDSEFNSCKWVRQKGLRIWFEEYLEERDLLENGGQDD